MPEIPLAAVAILVGIDKFMSECRALTNLVGNGVATLVISRWEGELDRDQLKPPSAHPVEGRRRRRGRDRLSGPSWPSLRGRAGLRRIGPDL